MPIGNDVVDLSDAGALGKHRDERFVQRVLAETERRWLAWNPDDRSLWCLWAAKEAVYKARAQFDSSPYPGWKGIVVVPGARRATADGVSYRIEWHHGPDFVHALAYPEGASPGEIWHRIAAAPTASRSLAKTWLAERGYDVEIENEKGSRRPRASRRGEPLANVALSFSHDGRYVAAAGTITASSSR